MPTYKVLLTRLVEQQLVYYVEAKDEYRADDKVRKAIENDKTPSDGWFTPEQTMDVDIGAIDSMADVEAALN